MPINEAVLKELLEGTPASVVKARLLSVSGLRASSWLSIRHAVRRAWAACG